MSKKVGRNDPCPCGSGKKYKRCCGASTEHVAPPDWRTFERSSRAVRQRAEDGELKLGDEEDGQLGDVTEGRNVPVWTPRTPLDHAQELIYQAWEINDKKERIRLAVEALKISEDCADAYVLLAEEAADTVDQARDWYQRGVEAGERALGPAAFKEDVGYFWGLIETRPYMRARAGLADCLLMLGDPQAAVAHYRDMLRLNPDDNQAIRYRLVHSLIETNDIDEAETLFEQYGDDILAAWHFARALATFRRQGDSPEARQQMQKAVERNPRVIPYLLGWKRVPRALPKYITPGGEDEAFSYVAEFGDVWSKVPGALDWVRSQAPRRGS